MPKRYEEEEEYFPEDEYEDEYEDEEDYDLEEDDDFEDELPPEERKLRKAGRFKIAAGLFDFLAVIAGLAVTLVFVALILTLVNWVISDLGNTFNFLLK